jgi:hypothetical protein
VEIAAAAFAARRRSLDASGVRDLQGAIVIRSTRVLMASCAAVAAAALLPSAAHAVLLEPATSCPEQVRVTPFAAWGDHAGYVRVGDGGFDQDGAGWRLSDAAAVDGGSPWPAFSPDADRALEIRGSATSPGTCVGIEHPTMRFFARNVGSPLGVLSVEVVLTTALGLKVAAPIGLVLRSGAWAPSPRMLVLGNLLMLAPGEKTRVSFRFTAVGLGAKWRIDDVYIDPYAKI